jgi:hypothetical protein
LRNQSSTGGAAAALIQQQKRYFSGGGKSIGLGNHRHILEQQEQQDRKITTQIQRSRDNPASNTYNHFSISNAFQAGRGDCDDGDD